MKVYDAKNIKHKDELAEKRRRVFILKILFFVGLAIVMAGFVLYLLFFSELLAISQVKVNGLHKLNSDEFNNRLNSRLDLKWLGLLEYQRNVVFFNSDAFMTEVLATFPEIKEMSVNKEPPHALNINVTERAIVGIWCFVDGSTALATSCKYFDEEGTVWGEAAKSSGFLVLVVEDLRQEIPDIIQQGSPQQVDPDLLVVIIFVAEQLKERGIFINKLIIPSDFIGDFSVFTSGGYELLFSTDSDISKQLEVLGIFLADKKNDPNFNPQYIDLRINGRIYYK